MSQIPFLVETTRVLEILSKQIYDSPYAMVRENVQNAYDAVLMRANKEAKPLSHYSIQITATPTKIEIVDDGIGMSEDTLRNNFWRAGSSGKNNDIARAAGVIGTFGIGAMANFGVCDHLQVETREPGAATGIRTSAKKSELSIGKDCIDLELVESGLKEGTKLSADIGAQSRVDVAALRNYVFPFVRFLRVPVRLNGDVISCEDPRLAVGISPTWRELGRRSLTATRFAFEVTAYTDGTQIGALVENISIDGRPTSDGIWLRQQAGQIMGLRSRFGLAPLPLPGLYQFGGFADLHFLVPTAGREALTRESIQEAAQLMQSIERAITEIIKDTELADASSAFQQHVLQLGQTAWASRVMVQLSPGDERVEMGQVRTRFLGEKLLWFAGTDPETISTFSSQERPLVRVSQQNPRRELQLRYIRTVLGLDEVPNTAQVLETYRPEDLVYSEITMMLSIARILRSDYLIEDIHIEWVRIGHGVHLLAEMLGDRLVLKLSRTWPVVQALIKAIEGSPELVDGLTKDLIRVHIYDRIKSFVPSSQRAGLDALQKTLARRRELYRLEAEDKGDLDTLVAEYLAGELKFQEVLTAATRVSSGQRQRVGSESVGAVESVFVDVVNAPPQLASVQTISSPVAGSPILRADTDVQERLLTTNRAIPQLNNHRVFLALSDRLFQLEREFFTWPHSTQVAWAGRRVVFLFGLAQSAQSLYYDIELRGNRTAGDAGGAPLVTTTIVTKNRIFVPVPPQLTDCFLVTDAAIEFFVRFDLLGNK